MRTECTGCSCAYPPVEPIWKLPDSTITISGKMAWTGCLVGVFVGTGVFVGERGVDVEGISVMIGATAVQASNILAEMAMPLNLRKSRRDSS